MDPGAQREEANGEAGHMASKYRTTVERVVSLDEDGANESRAEDYNSFDAALRGAKAQGWTHVLLPAAADSYILLKRFGFSGQSAWTSAELFKSSGRWHIGGPSTERLFQETPEPVPNGAVPIDEVIAGAREGDAKFERCVQHVKQSSPDANPWAVCHAALGREPEPYTRKNLNWHRADNGSYWNDDSDFGKIVVKQRPSDKRNQKLAWFAVVKKVEVVQGETRAEVNEAVEKHLRNPRTAAAAEECTRIVSRGDVDVIERDPACSPKGVDISSPKKLHAAMRELVAKSGQERFWAIGQSKQGEMVGQPVELAVGQVDHVAIDVATFVGTRPRCATRARCP